jgi:MFS family permease
VGALLCGAFFVVILDASIVFAALPSIGTDVGFSEQGLQWVLSAYALTFGGLLLLGGRAASCTGAAIMTPTALSIISTTFPEGPERNKALGIWGTLGGLGATAGWLIGGPLVDGPGWEWVDGGLARLCVMTGPELPATTNTPMGDENAA